MIKQKIFACDIDNTVSNQYSRFLKYFDHTTNKMNPAAFQYKLIFKDLPIPGAQEAISRLALDYKIFLVSARKQDMRDITLQWLSKHNFPFDEVILVNQNDYKIPVLKEIQPVVFVDDMKYDWENLTPKMCIDFIQQLDIFNINYEIFNNNWIEIANKYCLNGSKYHHL